MEESESSSESEDEEDESGGWSSYEFIALRLLLSVADLGFYKQEKYG